jgi:hypothetical protein
VVACSHSVRRSLDPSMYLIIEGGFLRYICQVAIYDLARSGDHSLVSTSDLL